MTSSTQEPVFIGRKIERIRRLKGIKQDVLAADLGISRQSLSRIEQSDSIDDERLEQVAKALGVSIEAIREFDEDLPIHSFNTFNAQCTGFNFNCTFNPIEKIVELYDALLKSQKEKIDLLESMAKQKTETKK